MKNLDNIAGALSSASKKASDQEQQEQLDAAKSVKNAAVDKVSTVADNSKPEDLGLTGATRTVAADTKPTVEREVKFAPIVASATATINDYELKMADNRRVTPEDIDNQQARLYNAIRAIVTVEDNSEFMGGMEFLFRKFREDKMGAFNGSTVRRRIHFMKKPSGEVAFKAYNGFLDLLQVFSDPKGRKALWPRFNKKQALDFLSDSPELRQRLETYMSRICS